MKTYYIETPFLAKDDAMALKDMDAMAKFLKGLFYVPEKFIVHTSDGMIINPESFDEITSQTNTGC